MMHVRGIRSSRSSRMFFSSSSSNFIKTMIRKDFSEGRFKGRVQTRFPPDPSGYLHIGHAKSIVLNFGVAKEFEGKCVLRFDDTNPETSTQQYCDSIEKDVSWILGKENVDENINYTSNYFDKLYEYAVFLVKRKKAYVCSLPQDVFARDYVGTTREVGKISPYFENRDTQDCLELLKEMKDGKHAPGMHVLRARIDMSSQNMVMRDPILMRVREETHFRGGARNIYPSYDFAHCISDALEGTTHSLCTLEFIPNNELYEWVLDAIELEKKNRVYQTEFARLNLTYTITSKRVLRSLVESGVVEGFDDPRLATLAGLRRRGIPSSSIVEFIHSIGVAKVNSFVDIEILEACIRRVLDHEARRVMCVLDPIKVILTNLDDDNDDNRLQIPNHPKRPELGERHVKFGREIYIEREDFQYEENAPKKFKRLTSNPNRSVRLRGAGMIRVLDVIENENGDITELHCEHHFERVKDFPKPKAVVHWVCAVSCDEVDLNLYESLFTCKDPMSAISQGDLNDVLNPNSKIRLENCKIESGPHGNETLQFERVGYFKYDPTDSAYNRTITLRSSSNF